MATYRLFDGDTAHVASREYHAPLARAPHLEQLHHTGRLALAALFLRNAYDDGARTFSDLGCGDGGLLSVVDDVFDDCWGYDIVPANVAGAAERNVSVEYRDVFNPDRGGVRFGDVSAVTEVLEHLTDPYHALTLIRRGSGWLVASSPWNEDASSHCPEHAWAWDVRDYAQMIEAAGWSIVRHELTGMFQVVLAR